MTEASRGSNRLLVIVVLVGMAFGLGLFGWCHHAFEAAARDREAKAAARQDAIARVRARRGDAGAPPAILAVLRSCDAFAGTHKRKAHTQIVCSVSNPGGELDAARVVGTVIEGGTTTARGVSEIALDARAQDEVVFSFEGALDAGPPACACAVEALGPSSP